MSSWHLICLLLGVYFYTKSSKVTIPFSFDCHESRLTTETASVATTLVNISDTQLLGLGENQDALKIHFIYEGNISDYAINYAMDKGRVEATERFYANYGRAIVSTFSVTQTEDMSELFSSLITEGYNAVICAGNPSLCSALVHLASDWGGLKFSVHAVDMVEGMIPPNVMIVKPKQWRGLWLAGLACGLQAKSNRVGLILPGIPSLTLSTVQFANAFYLGLQETRPGAELGLAIVDGWNVSISSRAAAQSLVEWGAGCMTAAQANAVPYQVFRDYDIPSVGYSINVRIFAGEFVQSSFLLDYMSLFYWHLELLNDASWLNETVIPEYSVIRRGDWSLQMPWSKRKLLDTYMTKHQNVSFRLFCREAFDTLGLPIPPQLSNSTDNCLPPELVFDSSIMKLTPHAKLIAVWDTETATKKIFWSFTHAMTIVCLCIAAVLGLFSIYTIPHIIWYRQSRVYTVPSWLVVLMIPIASLFTLASLVPYFGRPSVMNCQLRRWLESIGLIILTGSILARNYKHYTWKRDGLTVLTKDFLKRFTVSPYELFVMFLTPLLLAELAILVFWSSLSNVAPEFKHAPFLPFGTVETSCRLTGTKGPEYAWFAFNGAVCLTNLAFLFVLKNMPLLTSEVISSGGIILNTVVLTGITAFVSSVVGRQNVTVSIIVWLKVIIVAVDMFVLVAPKWWAVQILGVTEEVDVTETSNHTDSSSHGFVSRPNKSSAPQFYSESSASSVGSPISADENDDSISPAVTDQAAGVSTKANTTSADSTPASTQSKEYPLGKPGKAPGSDKEDSDRESSNDNKADRITAQPKYQEGTSSSSLPSEEEDFSQLEQGSK